VGRITVQVQGSFGSPEERTFSAMTEGHAAAVADAIQYLSSDLLPRAIKRDHALHGDGHFPDEGFGGERRCPNT